MRQEHRYRWRRRIAGTGVLVAVAAIAATSIAFAVDRDHSDSDHPSASAHGHTSSGAVGGAVPGALPEANSSERLRRRHEAEGVRPAVAGDPERVYVPNTLDGTISIIDPKTFKVIRTMDVGGQPHHITPAWNLRRLYVDNPALDRLSVIDPRTTKVTGSIPVASPYNLYFTPDGTKAIVVAEYDNLIEFRNPHTWKAHQAHPHPVPGRGPYGLLRERPVPAGELRVHGRGVPDQHGADEDHRRDPCGRPSDRREGVPGREGVLRREPGPQRRVGDRPGAHASDRVHQDGRRRPRVRRVARCEEALRQQPDRRIDLGHRFRTRRVVATWHIGGSPDMLQVSPNGKQLWTSNRFGDTVTVVSTRTGRVIHRITVGRGPHGLCFFPEPGRHSIGHNGVYR